MLSCVIGIFDHCGGYNMSSSFLLIKTAIAILDKHLLLYVSDTNNYEQVIIVICRKVKLLRIIGSQNI